MHSSKLATTTALVLISIVVAGCTASDEKPVEETTAPTTEMVPVATPTAEPTPGDEAVEVPETRPAAERQTQYDQAIASFPYGLPAGFTFPVQVPEFDYPSNLPPRDTGDAVAHQVWGCETIGDAWAAVSEGDVETADALFASVIGAIDAGAPGLQTWEKEILASDNLPQGPEMGTSGLCDNWLAIIGAP